MLNGCSHFCRFLPSYTSVTKIQVSDIVNIFLGPREQCSEIYLRIFVFAIKILIGSPVTVDEYFLKHKIAGLL